MKRLVMLGALLAALAAAGPAAADDGVTQSASSSVGTVQLGGATASPATAVSAPLNVNAPVAVASSGNGASNHSSTGGASAASTATARGTSAQSAGHAVGTVQVGSANVAPATAVNAPVNANAPVSVLSEGNRGGNTSSAGGATARHDGDSQPAGADQSASHAAGTVQVGSANVAPATAVNAPVNANAPVSVLSEGNRGGGNTGTSGGANADTDGGNGSGNGGQSADHSAATVQIGSVGLTPATAVNAPVNGNAPLKIVWGERATPTAGSTGSCSSQTSCGSPCGGSCGTPSDGCGASCPGGSPAPDGGNGGGSGSGGADPGGSGSGGAGPGTPPGGGTQCQTCTAPCAPAASGTRRSVLAAWLAHTALAAARARAVLDVHVRGVSALASKAARVVASQVTSVAVTVSKTAAALTAVVASVRTPGLCL